jgi:beta-lactamase class A
MRTSRGISPLRWFSVLVLLATLLLLVFQLVSFSRLRATFPAGMKIAGIPISGLDRQRAAQRLLEIYSLPVELIYGEQVIHLNPSVVDFTLDIESMLAAADLQRTEQSFWLDFWNYLWQRSSSPGNVPLRASFSEARLRDYLAKEIAPRYDKQPVPPSPAVGTVNFRPGTQGTALNIDLAVAEIDAALRSTSRRSVSLPLERTQPPRPSIQNLQILMQQAIDISGFDGLAGVYLLDLQTTQEINFIYQNGQNLPVQPDLAFTAASMIKIPIMVSAFRRINDNPDEETMQLVFLMIDRSGNEASDWLMDRVITSGQAPGPLGVSQDMQTLGLQNTFLAGYFYAGAPLLARYSTPGNQRSDVFTDPDPYNQTSLQDMGALLTDIYQCAYRGGGSLMAAFPEQITSGECQAMIDYLSKNRIGALIESGAPDGTKIAHKHGWVPDIFGVIRTIADAGIVFTPGGDYVLVMFLYDPEQLVWDPASGLMAELSRAAYNYFNLPEQ